MKSETVQLKNKTKLTLTRLLHQSNLNYKMNLEDYKEEMNNYTENSYP